LPGFFVRLEPVPPALPLDHLALRGKGETPALLLRGRALSYEALRARISRLGGWLNALIDMPGARVAAWLPKSELACLLPLAAARAGLVYVPINPLLKRAQVAHILADSGAALLIANPARLAMLEPGIAAVRNEIAIAPGETSPETLPPP
jgi:acyl-coenzyme A synthetase/AMP-(fatty) acid ligase